MIAIDKKIYRNLEEQVAQNTKLLNVLVPALNNKFLNIDAIYESLDQITSDSGWFLVGTENNYKLYYGHNLIGPFNFMGVPGPKGDTGIQGVQGARGPKGDKGEQGDIGLTGPIGQKGDKGDKGDKGEQGDPGESAFLFTVVAKINTVAELPSPSSLPRNYAYLVDSGTINSVDNKIYDLYIITGDSPNLMWTNIGPLNGVINTGNVTVNSSPNYVGTSSTILALSSDHGVAVATDTGHWYYWNGSAYVDGGLYVANISNAVYCIDNVLKDTNNNILTISKLNMPYEIVNKTYTLTSGKYVNADGGLSNGDQYKYTSNISLSKGEMVEFYGEGYSVNVAIISTIISGQRIPQVISIDNSVRYYQFMAVEDCEICVSYRDLGTADLRFYKFGDYTAINDNCAYAIDEIKSKSYTLSDNVVWNTGKYINAVGGISNSDQTQYSNPMQFNKGDIVVIKARGFDTNVAMISIYENGKYTPVVISDDREWKDYTYYCGSNCYLVFCTYSWATFTNARIFKSNFMKKYHDYINYEINKLNLDFNERDYFDFAVFENIGVVGDSYASGYINNSSKYNLSWLQIMARDLGITGYNFSAGGMTTQTWLTDTNRGLQYLLSTQKCGLYFLALGINDYINGGANYLGSIADINDSDPSQNANSFYGNYGKIISQIQTYSPSSRLVLLTIARDSDVPTSYNNAIIEIANHFNIPYIVQLDDWYFKSTIYNNMINGHPTALGYSGMSKALQRLLTKCVINNFDYFKNYIGIS